jgi:hypothetical protein
VDDDGRVAFVSTTGAQRIGAQEALRHRFLRPAALHERNKRRSLGSTSSQSSVEDTVDEVTSSRGGSGSKSLAGSGGKRTAAAARSGRGSGSATSGSGSAEASTSSPSSSRSGSGWWGLGRKKQPIVEEEVEEEAAVPVAASSSDASGGLFNAAAGLWRGLQDRLFDLEARMIKTASETAKQTTKVQALQEKVCCKAILLCDLAHRCAGMCCASVLSWASGGTKSGT